MEEAQRKTADYYTNDKKLLQETTTRQDTQHDKELVNERHTNKTRNPRQRTTSANHARP
jgi:hypothetical protein